MGISLSRSYSRKGSRRSRKSLKHVFDTGFIKKYACDTKEGVESSHYGATHLALDRLTNQQVALRIISKKQLQAESEFTSDRLAYEVNCFRKVAGQENVLHLEGAYEDEEFYYIVMELCDGGTIVDRIEERFDRKRNFYCEKEVASILRQMLKAVAFCHANGVAHRNIKIESFVYKSKDEDSCLKMVDFSSAAFFHPGEKSPFMRPAGCLYYMSPECISQSYGASADVWSLGIILYILLCGNPPFWALNNQGLVTEIVSRHVTFSAKCWQRISESAKDLIKKMLDKNPATRITAAAALSHPWIKEGGDAKAVPFESKIFQGIRQFVQYAHMKRLPVGDFVLAGTVESYRREGSDFFSGPLQGTYRRVRRTYSL